MTKIDEAKKIKAEIEELKKKTRILEAKPAKKVTKKAEAKPTKKVTKKAEAKPTQNRAPAMYRRLSRPAEKERFVRDCPISRLTG